MNDNQIDDDNHWTRWVGGAVFVACTMCTALDQAGYVMFGFPLGLPTCLIIAIFGGAIGGALSAKCRPAGFACGMVAGPGCLLSVYFYGQSVEVVTRGGLAVAMLAGSVPGLPVYFLCRWYVTSDPLGEVADESADGAPQSFDAAAFETLSAGLDDENYIPVFDDSAKQSQP